jgi:D-glycerate 3-kinase
MSHENNLFLKLKKKYLNFLKKQKILGEPFYKKFQQLNFFYIPICRTINKLHIQKKRTILIGLSGGQGSGKTTIGKILKLIMRTKYNLNVVNFSIDDFYKTKIQRKKMSSQTHELFLTRGVPGTHDTLLLKKCLKNLLNKNFKPFYMPIFNKAVDNRLPLSKWRKISFKPEIVIFEGWCVGAKAQNNRELVKSINILEKKYDKNMIWRKKVNNELKNKYHKIFKLIDKLIFLKVPSFKHVFKWRLLQEKKLKINSRGKKIMSREEIKNFIMFYERITLKMIKDFKDSSNIIINLDKKHRLSKIKFN